MPQAIKDQLTALNALIEKHPKRLPLRAVADVLGMGDDALRAALMRKNVPFGFGYQLDDDGYRVLVIPTVTFYLWYTNTTAQMALKEA